MSEPQPPQLRVWAVRGAVQAERNDSPSILGATEELMRELMRRNSLEPEDFISVISAAARWTFRDRWIG